MIKHLVYISSILICYAVAARGLSKSVPAPIQDFSYLASIEVNSKHVCSAVIVDDYYVLATNSCAGALNVSTMVVRVGTSRLGRRGQVTKASTVTHYFDPMDLGASDSDLILISVAYPFKYSQRVMWLTPSLLPIKQNQTGMIPVWTDYTKSGSVLLYSPVTVMESASCTAAYATYNGFNLTSTMFCLSASGSNSSPCLADPGIPMYFNEHLYGMVVFNPGCSSSLPVVVESVNGATGFMLVEMSGAIKAFE